MVSVSGLLVGGQLPALDPDVRRLLLLLLLLLLFVNRAKRVVVLSHFLLCLKKNRQCRLLLTPQQMRPSGFSLLEILVTLVKFLLLAAPLNLFTNTQDKFSFTAQSQYTDLDSKTFPPPRSSRKRKTTI